MAWTPIIGKGYTQKEFQAYLDSLDFSKLNNTWSSDKTKTPQFVVIHNTAQPTLKDWHKYSGETRMRGLENFYKNERKWSAGPHLFIADDLIWVFTPLNRRGTHSPSWNYTAWGFEMVGDFNKESFTTGAGAKVRENAIFATAALYKKAGFNPSTIRFHKEDPATDHDCPGKNVIKLNFVAAVREKLDELKSGKINWAEVAENTYAPTAAPYAAAAFASIEEEDKTKYGAFEDIMVEIEEAEEKIIEKVKSWFTPWGERINK